MVTGLRFLTKMKRELILEKTSLACLGRQFRVEDIDRLLDPFASSMLSLSSIVWVYEVVPLGGDDVH